MKKNKILKAFTLIELLVVATIIIILTAVVIVNLDKSKAKSRDAQRKTDLSKIAQALDAYKLDNKAYPVSASSFDLYVTTGNPLTSPSPSLVSSGYLQSMPVDPKRTSSDPSRTYKYQATVADYKLIATQSETIASAEASSNNCDSTILSKKAGDFCDPMNKRGFQISTSSTSRGWTVQ